MEVQRELRAQERPGLKQRRHAQKKKERPDEPADEQGSRPRSPRTRDGAEKPSEPSGPLGPWEREMALPKAIQLKSKEEEKYHAPATGALDS